MSEPTITVCRPIVPLGDLRRAGATDGAPETVDSSVPFAFVRQDNEVRWRLRTDDWLLTSPALPPTGAPVASSEAVLDVYVGLLTAFTEAGLPQDNTVRFTPSSFLKRLGWTAHTRRKAPTGPQFRQLDLALDYLRHASIESEAVRAQLESLLGGVRLLRTNFGVLQSWSKVGRGGRLGSATVVEARFSDLFAVLLRHQAGAVGYCGAMFATIPRGVPRALLRYLAGLRATTGGPTATVAAASVLAHIGCRRRELEPSRMHAILDEPHHLLAAHGVLGDIPEWTKSGDGEWQLVYLLESAPNLPGLLEESARAFGVTTTSAKNWAAHDTARLAEVLAGAAQGILTPTRTIGAMTNHYMTERRFIDQAALPHFEPGRGIVMPRPRCHEFDFLEKQYRETRDWLQERPEVEDALRRQFLNEGRLEWVVEGLMLLAARRMRGAETLNAWNKRRQDQAAN